MAVPFLKSVARYIHSHHKDSLENLCIILPNKRGSVFLKKYLSEEFSKTIWVPEIISIDEWIKKLSGLLVLDEVDLMCALYESYVACYEKDAESFEGFLKWGQIILKDFNEIDFSLADATQLYENLKDIKEIENWSLGKETLSAHQVSYLEFMKSLSAIYLHFGSHLLKNNWAYQGLSYRRAAQNAKNIPELFNGKQYLVCGFNAFTQSEEEIFLQLNKNKSTEFLWDTDDYYCNNRFQEAGLFLRKNLTLFNTKQIQEKEFHFKTEKHIEIISVSKQMGQSQVVAQSIQGLLHNNIPLDKIAVVLANEKLLLPVLKQMPVDARNLNITIPYPLRLSTSFGFVEMLLNIQFSFNKQNRKNNFIYHKDFVSLILHPVFIKLSGIISPDINLQKITFEIAKRNLIYIYPKILQEFFGNENEGISGLLKPADSLPGFLTLIKSNLNLLYHELQMELKGNSNIIESESILIIVSKLNRLEDLFQNQTKFNDISVLKQLYTRLVSGTSIPFEGLPLQGLQIMGMLETRTLDFEYIILVGANEGILPSPKNMNSFIPFDLRRFNNLLTYEEKDAVYAYHFYRLLQRAKKITITYDNETDTFGKGEKSRFITQLLTELPEYTNTCTYEDIVATAHSDMTVQFKKIDIEKTENILEVLKEKLTGKDEFSGLSPTAINTFKECGLKFYFRYAAQLKENEEVEETLEAGSFGSVLHLSLEKLYANLIDKPLSEKLLEEKLIQSEIIAHETILEYLEGKEPVGKNILQEDVIKYYVKKIVMSDLASVKKYPLNILALEKEFEGELKIKAVEKDYTVKVKGKIDRLDYLDGIIRIIDYKSSLRNSDKFIFEGFDLLFNDVNYNKQLQLIIYCWLLFKTDFCPPEKMQCCIIPLKTFTGEPTYVAGTDKKPMIFTHRFFMEFENELSFFVSRIQTENYFSQTPDEDICVYCSYNAICMR